MDSQTASTQAGRPRPDTASAPLRVALAVTAAPSGRGSMARYAALVERALGEGDCGPSMRPVRIDLAPDRPQGPTRHAWIAGAAMRRLARWAAESFAVPTGTHNQ